jgi:hypothetical protein
MIGVAVLVVGLRKAPYGFEDAEGFHVVGASPSPRSEIVSEHPADDVESKAHASELIVQRV